MSVTGIYSFSVTRDDIIREAMLNIGAIGEAETPTAQEVTDCARKLNMMCKQWMSSMDFAPGLKMWQRQRADLVMSSNQYQYELGPSTADDWMGGVAKVPGANYYRSQLTANVAASATTITVGTAAIAFFTVADFVVIQLNSGDIYSTTVSTINTGAGTFTIPSPGMSSAAAIGSYVWNYTMKAQRPLEVVTCVLRDTYGADTPLNKMTLQDYEFLPSKVQTGFVSDPSAFYYESQFVNGTAITGGGQMYLDVAGAQDVTKILHMVYMRPVMDLNNPGDNPEFPQQWYRPLCWGLSREISGMFDAEWTRDMESNYQDALAMARHQDGETTTLYFQSNGEM